MAGLLTAFGIVVACASSTTNEDGSIRVTTILAPDQAQFSAVSPMIERRCATLDCHGQAGRPLRLYSGRGLRLPNDAGLGPGVGDTTDEEIAANYRAVIGLEPEQLTRVIEGVKVPRDLLLLKKPLNLEGHKGGPAFAPTNDPAEVCLATWIKGTVDTTACTKAIEGL
ncbi:hypothetical protein BH09MYX1_BH09MYX1_46350 [soil metagenome]